MRTVTRRSCCQRSTTTSISWGCWLTTVLTNLADRQGNTALCLAVAPIPADERPRDPDPHGARQLATVKALLQLDAGSLLPAPPAFS